MLKLQLRDQQILALNRTCSIWYQNLVPEKNGTRLHCTRTTFWLVSVFWYQNLVPVSGTYVMGITFAYSTADSIVTYT